MLRLSLAHGIGGRWDERDAANIDMVENLRRGLVIDERVVSRRA